MDDEFDPLTRAVLDFDIAALHRLVAEGADLNARDDYGEPFLFNALFQMSHYDEASQADAARYEVIASLIELGADPHRLADDGASILIGPIFSQDAVMVELLLARDVDPNRGCGEPWKTIYELASFDYYYEAWIRDDEPAPAVSESVGTHDEDELLRRLDQDARTRGRLRPEILMILRKYGALGNGEMARKLGGDGSERIAWRDDRWHLDEVPIDERARRAVPSGLI